MYHSLVYVRAACRTGELTFRYGTKTYCFWRQNAAFGSNLNVKAQLAFECFGRRMSVCCRCEVLKHTGLKLRYATTLKTLMPTTQRNATGKVAYYTVMCMENQVMVVMKSRRSAPGRRCPRSHACESHAVPAPAGDLSARASL